MPVNPVRRSKAAQDVAQEALLGSFALFEIGDKSGFEPGSLEMIPIYSISARNILAGRWNRGWRSGWRYIWTREDLDFGITIEVRRGNGQDHRLASTSVGQAAVKLHEDLKALTAELIDDRRRYRPRILRMTWIGLEAIWLNTDSLRVPDRFLERTGRSAEESPPLRDGKFRREAIRRCKAFVAIRPTT